MISETTLEAKFTEEDITKAVDAVYEATRLESACRHDFDPELASELIERLRPYALGSNGATLCFHGLQALYEQRTGKDYQPPTSET